MSARFTEEEIQKIVSLREVSKSSYEDIAKTLNRLDKHGMPNARSVMTQYLKAKKQPTLESPKQLGAAAPITQPHVQLNPDLNELSKKQRVTFIKDKLPLSERGKHIFNNVLSKEEQALFLEEYFNVLREEDSITSAEEQQLFNAILHLILAWRAAAQDRTCYMKSTLSGYKGDDAQVYTDTFKRDHQENIKKYNDFMRGLKLSREQRLKDLQRQGTTFLDFAEKFSKNDEQAKAIDQILKYEGASQEELLRLQRNGWLIGGGLPNNNEPNFESSDRAVKNDTEEPKN